jgi:hypothetical protein
MKELIRSSPSMLASLCDSYGVQPRAGGPGSGSCRRGGRRARSSGRHAAMGREFQECAPVVT